MIERAKRRCSKCHELGHRRNKCGEEPKAPQATTIALDPVRVGDRFVVVEDLVEADPRRGGPWVAETEFVALELLGEVDGYEEWRLRADAFPEAGCFFESVGVPQLHPFQRRPTGGRLEVPLTGSAYSAREAARRLEAQHRRPPPAPVALDEPRLDPPVLSPPPCLVLARTRRACRSCRARSVDHLALAV